MSVELKTMETTVVTKLYVVASFPITWGTGASTVLRNVVVLTNWDRNEYWTGSMDSKMENMEDGPFEWSSKAVAFQRALDDAGYGLNVSAVPD